MSIPVSCSGCGKRFKAPDKGAGKKVPCPACKTTIQIPDVLHPEAEDDDYRLEEPAPRPAAITPAPRPVAPKPVAPAGWSEPQPHESPEPAASPAPGPRGWVPPTKSSTPDWLRHLHWCLALAMIPLAISVVIPDGSESDAAETSSESSAASDSPAGAPSGDSQPTSGGQSSPAEDSQLTPEEEARLIEQLKNLSHDELMDLLPDQLPGAFLSRHSYMHWLFALISVGLFLTFLVFLASDRCAQPLHLVGLGFFTATGGILLLLIVQGLSGLGTFRVRGAAGLILLVLALIGLSYSMALDPEVGFVPSLIGFTLGVGLCEEICKALLLLIYYRIGNQQTWRGAFLWGLASGVGFGVSEGIMYSASYYNGVAGPGIYIVRFVSCVALHAIWAGSVGISINQRQYLLQEDTEEWWLYLLAVLRMIAVPMFLHGLYDTFLKKDLELLALLTAAASFGYLAWQISNLRGSDDEDERAAYVAKYIRSKAAAQQA